MLQMGVDRLPLGRHQPWYHVLADTRDRPGAQKCCARSGRSNQRECMVAVPPRGPQLSTPAVLCSVAGFPNASRRRRVPREHRVLGRPRARANGADCAPGRAARIHGVRRGRPAVRGALAGQHAGSSIESSLTTDAPDGSPQWRSVQQWPRMPSQTWHPVYGFTVFLCRHRSNGRQMRVSSESVHFQMC